MVKVGLVGAGFMGRMHANVYQALPGAELVAIADERPDAVQKLATDFSATPYPNIEAMLKATKLDLVDICLPTGMHADATVTAANAGVNVLSEKPMAVTLEQADRMIAAAHSNNVSLMVAHCIRFWPEYLILTDYIKSNKLGKLLTLSLARVSPRPKWSANNWLLNPELSGSAALDLHIHDVDYALSLFGRPDNIVARGAGNKQGISHIHALLTFGNLAVNIEGGWGFPTDFPFKASFRALFENGAVVMDGGPLAVYEDGKEVVYPKVESKKIEGAGGNVSDLAGYYNEIAYYVDCISKGVRPEKATPESARLSLEVALQEIEDAKKHLS